MPLAAQETRIVFSEKALIRKINGKIGAIL
jgi:hypothetical protein